MAMYGIKWREYAADQLASFGIPLPLTPSPSFRPSLPCPLAKGLLRPTDSQTAQIPKSMPIKYSYK